MTIYSGNGQTGTPGQPLPVALSVRVVEQSGVPTQGVAVTFTVAGGGGSLSAVQVSTNAQGVASTTLTLGGNGGVNTVLAAAANVLGSPVTFTATGQAAAGASTIAAYAGNGQTATIGTALAQPLTVVVRTLPAAPFRVRL